MKANFWNSRYSQEEYVYGQEPNIFFSETLQSLDSGKILLPADGEGRNGVYAAMLGWEVTSFDASTAGQYKAEQLARQKGVELNYQIHTYQSFESSPNYYDSCALIYSHIHPDQRKKFHQKLRDWLKVGATIILEAFNKEQLTRTSGGPKDPDMLYHEEMLRSDFYYCSDVNIENKIIQLSEGKHHVGEASVIRMIAKI